ncbi:MAG: hypothetical protein L0H93_06195 [Nocardioides sp.]|nr:hypothetical protein [Nocardioides sp.]
MSGSAEVTGARDQIAALRDLVNDARSMPMSSSAVVNRKEVLDLLDRLEESRIAELREATEVLARRDAIVAEAEASAAETLRQARIEGEHRASDTEVYRLAQRQATALHKKAESESEALKNEADVYIEGRFVNFEHALERTLGEVRRGLLNLGVSPETGTQESTGDDVLLTGPDAG